MRGIAAVLFGLAVAASGCATAPVQEAVVVNLKLSDAEFGASGETFALYPVEDALSRAVGSLGVVDGHEIGGGYFVIYIYGESADRMYEAIKPTLNNLGARTGSFVVKRGPNDSIGERLEL